MTRTKYIPQTISARASNKKTHKKSVEILSHAQNHIHHNRSYVLSCSENRNNR